MRAPPLPSNDFAQEFEAKFLTCDEHLVSRVAFKLNRNDEVPLLMHSTLAQAKSLNQRHHRIWNLLSVNTVNRSSMLFHIAPVLKIELEEEIPEISNDQIEQGSPYMFYWLPSLLRNDSFICIPTQYCIEIHIPKSSR